MFNYYFDSGWWGLGICLYWSFWMFLLVTVLSFMTPVARKRARLQRLTPSEIPHGRNATGDLTTEEYEERQSRLERAQNQGATVGNLD